VTPRAPHFAAFALLNGCFPSLLRVVSAQNIFKLMPQSDLWLRASEISPIGVAVFRVEKVSSKVRTMRGVWAACVAAFAAIWIATVPLVIV
jgi:hypothetical protein